MDGSFTPRRNCQCGDKLGPKRVPDLKPRDRLFSHEVLRRKMSEVVSLRERVAQAELAVGDRVIDRAPVSAVSNEDPCATD